MYFFVTESEKSSGKEETIPKTLVSTSDKKTTSDRKTTSSKH
jgi:hypothetical protein